MSVPSSTPVLAEALRLHKLGLSIIWIKPRSKAPVKSGWTSGPRIPWEELKATYKPGYNLGVRLGSTSVIAGKYLAAIDVDVLDPILAQNPMSHVRKIFPLLPKDCAKVWSGSGNGSFHLYILTDKPAKSLKLMGAQDGVKEIAIMGEGRQCVLPPSVHPSGKNYKWASVIDKTTLATVAMPGVAVVAKEDWKPETVDLAFSDLPQSTVDMILFANTEDRSAAMLGVAAVMASHDFTDNQITSVLTDRQYALGQTAYDHTKSESRKRAAEWVYKHTLAKVRTQNDPQVDFSDLHPDGILEQPILDHLQIQAQRKELLTPFDWRLLIERNGPKGVNANAPRKTLKNLILILTHAIAPDIFKRNLFSNIDAYGATTPWGGYKGRSITDDDAVLMKDWFARTYRFEPDLKLIYEAISVIALKNGYHPVREYLKGLEWDGISRVDTWLKTYVNAEGPEPYLSEVSRKILLAMVTRVFIPGCKFDFIPVLEGAQGIGKSSVARILAGDEWFADNLPDLRSADARLNLHGKWVVEMAELANLKMGELETIKAYIASPSDRVRAPYGRKAMDIKRQSVFIGTTNESSYLKDKTGNRRYWPVAVGQCDFKGLTEIRDQLFAETYFIFENCDENLWLEDEVAKSQAVAQQMERVGEDEESIMAEHLQRFIEEEGRKNEAERFNFMSFSLSDLFGDFKPFQEYRSDMKHLQMGGRILKAAGFTKFLSNGRSRWRKGKIGYNSPKGREVSH